MKKVIAHVKIEGAEITVLIETEGIEAVADVICRKLKVEIRTDGERCERGEKTERTQKTEERADE